MKCPKCGELGLKSRVQSKGGTSTLLGTNGWYDEDGNYHYHDGNTTTTVFFCSEGHTFVIRKKGSPCISYPEKCDYAGGEEEIKIIE